MRTLRRAGRSFALGYDERGQEDPCGVPRDGRFARLRQCPRRWSAPSRPSPAATFGAACSTMCLLRPPWPVIGLEAKAALDKYGVEPDTIIGCVGGGSNFGGLIATLHGRQDRGEERQSSLSAWSLRTARRSPAAKYAYRLLATRRKDDAARAHVHARLRVHASHTNHAGGLRYHGMQPDRLQTLS